MSSISMRGDAKTIRARAIAGWHRFRMFVHSKLTWGRLYRTTSYLKSALWTVPLIAIALELLLAPLLAALDAWLGWRLRGFAPAEAQALYQTVVTLTLSFLVFTFGSLLVVIQVASGQLTSRIIATTLLRDNVVRYSVGLFVFTLFLAVSALNRQQEAVRELVALVIALLGIACIADFLLLIDYAARLLRPVSVVAKIADEGIAVIGSVYPDPAIALTPEAAALHERPAMPSRVVGHGESSGIVLAVVHAGGAGAALRRLDRARASDRGFHCRGAAALHGGAIAIKDRAVLSTVAFGPERTLEQDPMFAFRIIVDIALKALSPAINDPTTAVVALDQVQRLLRMVGLRRLRGEVILDDSAQPRLIFRTPNWEDYVHVACSEIRACGATNLQVVRRMRAMLEDLGSTLPPYRHAALQTELDLLDWAIREHFTRPEELALARIADSQGLGGSPSTRVASANPKAASG